MGSVAAAAAAVVRADGVYSPARRGRGLSGSNLTGWIWTTGGCLDLVGGGPDAPPDSGVGYKDQDGAYPRVGCVLAQEPFNPPRRRTG